MWYLFRRVVIEVRKERLSSDGAVGQNVRRAAYTSDIKIMKTGLVLLIYMKGVTSITLKHALEQELLGTKVALASKLLRPLQRGLVRNNLECSLHLRGIIIQRFQFRLHVCPPKIFKGIAVRQFVFQAVTRWQTCCHNEVHLLNICTK
jgi:hypothetical protein